MVWVGAWSVQPIGGITTKGPGPLFCRYLGNLTRAYFGDASRSRLLGRKWLAEFATIKLRL